MKIPFAGLFQRKSKADPAAEARVKTEAPLPSVKKSESERLGKTVLPSSSRAVTQPEQPEQTDKGNGAAIPTETARAAAPAQSPGAALGGNTAETPVSKRPKISMGGTPLVPQPHLPPAVAFALEPNIERAIALPLADVIAHMPEGYLKARESFDLNRPVLLKAVEVEKGMAIGQPAIPVAAIFQQAPDIFIHTVPVSDDSMIALPFQRVMDALSKLAVRSDQAAEQSILQIETPFLQVTLEDTKRFGTPMPPIARANPAADATELPPVRIEPPTAEAFAAAVPEAADAFVPRPHVATGGASEQTSASSRASESAAMRIPFTPSVAPGKAEPQNLGTGEPAFPRVPASSGPPVPSAPTAPPAPSPVPFSFPAPCDDIWKSVKEQDPGPRGEAEKKKPELAAQEMAETEATIDLALRPILQSLPPMQLGGNPSSVPSYVTVSFPMSLITPQLASGKVMVRPNAFYAVLPEEYRRFFLPAALDAPVQLPLADVLASLPGQALRIREDQEVHTPEEVFETPFAAKAAEDALRFATKGEGGEQSSEPKGQTSEAGGEQRFDGAAAVTAEAVPKFDAKEAVAKACRLSGVQSCSVIFSDGLSIAGNIPESMHVDGLSAVAPTLLQKLENHMRQTSLGPLLGMTVHGAKVSLSFFTAGNVCLTALHTAVELSPESRGELGRITEELSLAYSEPAPSATGG